MMPLVPMRFLFRSRWAALAWCAGICWMAISFAGGDNSSKASANSSDSNAAQVSTQPGQ